MQHTKPLGRPKSPRNRIVDALVTMTGHDRATVIAAIDGRPCHHAAEILAALRRLSVERVDYSTITRRA